MSEMHLKDLKRMIESRKWTILLEEDGDDFAISATWIIENQAGKKIRLVFEGMEDLSVLPIEKSYGCYVEETKSKGLYFGKNDKGEWRKNLEKFADEMGDALTDRK